MKKLILLLTATLLLVSCGANSDTSDAVETIVTNTATVYKDQNLKARDTSRLMDMLNIETAINLYYMDYSEYPDSLDNSDLLSYLNGELPIDVKNGETINDCIFGYTYEVFNDEYYLVNQKFILSTCLEFEENIEKFAKDDNGIYDNKFEKGVFPKRGE